MSRSFAAIHRDRSLAARQLAHSLHIGEKTKHSGKQKIQSPHPYGYEGCGTQFALAALRISPRVADIR